MPRRFLFFLISLVLVLSACAGNAPQMTATPAPTATNKPTVRPAATSTKQPGCTVKSPLPTPGPTEQSLFPPHKDTDQVKGPDNAAVTLIEYSDFQ